MPAFICESKVGLRSSVKAALAKEITTAVIEIIKSDLTLISVIFHDLPDENAYRAGEPTSEAVIFGHIRKGRSKSAISTLGLALSRIWCEQTSMSEDQVEIALAEYPAEYTFRYGKRLPEPPYV